MCCDDEIGESDGKNDEKEQGSASAKMMQNLQPENQHTRQHENRSSIASNTGQRNSSSSMSDQESIQMDESSFFSASIVSAAPVCRQFWKAGNYDIGHGSKPASQNAKNHLCVHPMFLRSNATSHKWAFGAIAELIDNAVDEEDDGGGMDPEAIRHCMSFGFSDKKSKFAIGQYGNGFKTSSMRLGADVIVFSRQLKRRPLTQSVGLLSYTFLRQTGHDRIVVPMVDYDFNSSIGKYEPILTRGKRHFLSNLSMLLQWSPYSTKEELLSQFNDIGQHGTKIVIYNLWLNDEGDVELDFDSDIEDIRINRGTELCQEGECVNPIYEQHMANVYHYSLRVYSSILYLRMPQCFKIILRGQVVEHHSIANDLKFWEVIVYRPQRGTSGEVPVLITIGFLKDAPHVNIHGFNVYHRNRLILPFWRVVKNTTNSNARGVVGVLEGNFIEPTHNKQDFEKTSLFQRLEDRLKQMTMEYWHFHCGLIGYQQVRKTRAPVPSNWYPDQPVLMNQSCNVVDSSTEASSAVGSSQNLEESYKKRKKHKLSVELEHAKRVTGLGLEATDILHIREEKGVDDIGSKSQNQEKSSLIRENEKLQSRLLEFQKTEKELKQKVQKIRSQLEDVHRKYPELLSEYRSMSSI